MDDRSAATSHPPSRLLDPSHVEALLSALQARGHRVVGPVCRDHAIVYDEIESIRDLPIGWTDEQGPGRYRLKRRSDEAWFGFAVGPHSWKRFLHPPLLRLWSAERRGPGDWRIESETADSTRLAFVGVRACELAAMARQDQVLRDGPFPDPTYVTRRRALFIVAVHCTEPGGTCFCRSMGTGPAVERGADLILTEVVDADRHAFLADAGSEAGAELLAEVGACTATEGERTAAAARVTAASGRMGRVLDTSGLREALLQQAEDPRWDQVASRCVTCGNCTAACPTCFCTAVEDTTDLTGARAEHWRRWDSCFTTEFSHLHGRSARSSPRSRYRQWLTHKLATWWDQFGVSGCVGCGRCITWCPVGIDITVEAQALGDLGVRAPAEVSGQEPIHGDPRATAG